jgi:aspartyl-tRNA(Asn)/glutamyl-tRNA(Gln) amidotransferase subunit C
LASGQIDVAYVARLAHIRLTDSEQAAFQRQLETILAYVDKIAALDVTGIEPTSHGQPVYNIFREDQVKPGLPRDPVLANAPERIGDEFRVPRIME